MEEHLNVGKDWYTKKKEEDKEGIKVIVSVRFEPSVQYEIRVKNPKDLEEIKEKLRNKDASEWKADPNFYEELGMNWDELIEKVDKDDVLVGVSAGDRIYVGNLGDATVTNYNNPDGIEVYLVEEEDNAVSWQIIPDERSDKVLHSVKVIPDNPIE